MSVPKLAKGCRWAMPMSLFATAHLVVSAVINWFWVGVDGSMLHRGIVRLLYFPSILRLSLLEGPRRRWYDRVDSTVLVGALPFRSQTKELVEKENVRAVLSYNEPYELNFFTNSEEEWARHGVRQRHFNTIDFSPPSLGSLSEGLKVIEECKLRNESVYIHCKAGKGRSATATVCYLMKAYSLSPAAAVEQLRSKRPQITINPRQMKRIAEFEEHSSKTD